MSDEAILTEIRQVVADILDDADIGKISENTTAEEVTGWDSVEHVRILMALERKYKFRFSDEDLQKLKKVGDLIDVISRHVKA